MPVSRGTDFEDEWLPHLEVVIMRSAFFFLILIIEKNANLLNPRSTAASFEERNTRERKRR